MVTEYLLFCWVELRDPGMFSGRSWGSSTNDAPRSRHHKLANRIAGISAGMRTTTSSPPSPTGPSCSTDNRRWSGGPRAGPTLSRRAFVCGGHTTILTADFGVTWWIYAGITLPLGGAVMSISVLPCLWFMSHVTPPVQIKDEEWGHFVSIFHQLGRKTSRLIFAGIRGHVPPSVSGQGPAILDLGPRRPTRGNDKMTVSARDARLCILICRQIGCRLMGPDTAQPSNWCCGDGSWRPGAGGGGDPGVSHQSLVG